MGGYTAPILEAAEPDFDAAAASVPAFVVFDGLAAGFPPRDACFDALFLTGVPESVRDMAAVAEQPLPLWQIVQQGCRTGIIAHLACGMKKLKGRPFALLMAWTFVFMPSLVQRSVHQLL